MRTTDIRSLTRIALCASITSIAFIALCACSPEAATASGSAAERTRSGEAPAPPVIDVTLLGEVRALALGGGSPLAPCDDSVNTRKPKDAERRAPPQHAPALRRPKQEPTAAAGVAGAAADQACGDTVDGACFPSSRSGEAEAGRLLGAPEAGRAAAQPAEPGDKRPAEVAGAAAPASEASPPFDGDTSPPFNGDISE